MKKYLLLLFGLAAFFAAGCSGTVEDGNKNKEAETVEEASELEEEEPASADSESEETESASTDSEETELTVWVTEAPIVDNHFTVSISENDIVITESDSDEILNTIPIEYDASQLFLSMADEENGYLLCCSSGAAGQMMKLLYTTEDGWNTCSEVDISNLIDGYPTSLSALSMEHLYIGAQMRSDGYLFESTDGGEEWKPVQIDESIARCRYGYVPIYNEEKNMLYVLLECDGFYSIYQSDNEESTWEKVGIFSLDSSEAGEIEKYFIQDGDFYITTSQGGQYMIEDEND